MTGRTTPGEITIIHEPTVEDPFLIVDKPAGLASAPLRKGDDSAVTRLLHDFPDIAGVSGRKPVEGGLVHRLDTETSGLLLIATSQTFYERIIAEQEAGRFVKSYSAECDDARALPLLDGFPPRPSWGDCCKGGAAGRSVFVESRFRPWGLHGRAVRPVTEDAGPAAQKKASPALYRTEIMVEPDGGGAGRARASCRITRGYRHQVRCHLAWLGFPVRGDSLYNPSSGRTGGEGDALCFRATGLDFLHLSFRLN